MKKKHVWRNIGEFIMPVSLLPFIQSSICVENSGDPPCTSRFYMYLWCFFYWQRLFHLCYFVSRQSSSSNPFPSSDKWWGTVFQHWLWSTHGRWNVNHKPLHSLACVIHDHNYYFVLLLLSCLENDISQKSFLTWSLLVFTAWNYFHLAFRVRESQGYKDPLAHPISSPILNLNCLHKNPLYIH